MHDSDAKKKRQILRYFFEKIGELKIEKQFCFDLNF